MKKLIISSLIFTSFLTVANEVAKKDKWKLMDYSTSSNPHGECMAYTDRNGGKYRLEIRKKKNTLSSLEIYIATKDSKWTNVTQIGSTLQYGQRLAFIRVKQGSENYYYNIPSANSYILNQLKNRSELVVNGLSNSKKKTFRSRGFATILQAMETRCNKGAPLVDSRFENLLLGNTIPSLEASYFNESDALHLKSLVDSAHKAYSDKQNNKQVIAHLTSRYQSFLTEESSLKTRESSLQGSLSTNQNNTTYNDQAQRDAQAILDQLKEDIPKQESSVRIAKNTLSTKESIIAPYKEDHANLSSDAITKRSDLTQMESDLASYESDKYNAENKLYDLDRDLRGFNRILDDYYDDLNDAIYYLDVASYEYDRFYYQYEKSYRSPGRGYKDKYHGKRRMHGKRSSKGNYRHGGKYPEIKHWRHAQEIYHALDRKRRDQKKVKKSLKKQLKSCRKQAGKDCTALAAQFTAADRKLDGLEQKCSEASGKVRHAKRKVDNIKREIDRDYNGALTRYNYLVDEVDNTESDVYDTERSIDEYETVKDIAIREIPRVRRLISNQTPITIQAESDLSDYEAKVNWTTKKTELDNAQSDFDSKDSILKRSYTSKQNNTDQVSRSKSRRIELQSEKSNLQASLSNIEASLVRVGESLRPYYSEKLGLDNIEAGYDGEIQRLSSEYLTRLGE